MNKKNVLIMGAAGRDFHNFNVVFRNNPEYNVKAFTAFQIPNIDDRTYPAELAGDLYPSGIPIFPEEQMPQLIKDMDIDEVVFAYSDVSHEEVMHRAAIANACGVSFRLLGAEPTMIKSSKPVIAVCAVRTGCGKSQTTRRIGELLRAKGKKVVVIRHPMPYGDLAAQACQRFATLEDMDTHKCTIEEREEYESHVQAGHVVYAGVDYERILREAEKEADIILWDGGNNDTPFYKPDLYFVVADPHRAGHELRYYPGETNFRMADIIILNKIDTASKEGIQEVLDNIRTHNPKAQVIQARSEVSLDDPNAVEGKRVLVVEDGPTLTHGEMTYGAGHVAAKKFGVAEIVDPRPYAIGTIKETFKKYSHVEDVLPAMGYGDKQVQELKETIEKVPCDAVIVGTPFDLGRLIQSSKNLVRVTYDVGEAATKELEMILGKFVVKN